MDELLRIDPEFESKIPPLTEEEYQLLEENILQDGVVLNPLIVWNGCIVDGHNRFRIIQAHPEIKYTVFEKEFPDRYAAIAWICCNQLGRRNLTPQQKKYLIGQRYEAEKLAMRFSANHVYDYIELSEDYSIYEIAPPEGWLGKSLKELDIRNKYHINILGVKRGEKVEMISASEYKIKKDDHLMILGRKEDTEKILKQL